MNLAAEYLVGTHDFAAFGSPTEGTPSTVRRVLETAWLRDESLGLLCFTISGTGFLRYMVRSIVGTLARVGSGKIRYIRVRRHSEVLRPLPLGSCRSSPRLVLAIGEL